MNRLVNWFAANPIAANFLMLFIVLAGLSGISDIDKEVQPNLNENVVTVSIPYPGAGPRDIEKQICVRVEESVETLQGIKQITCSAKNNIGIARIEASNGYSLDKLLDNIKSRIDAVSTFPANSERPIVEQSILRVQSLSIGIIGTDDEKALKEIAYEIKEELSALQQIPEVAIVGVRDYEVSIEVDEQALRKYGLSFNQISTAISQYSLNLGGGVIRAESGEVQIQARNQSYIGSDFARIPLRGNSTGESITLGDVATIRDAFIDEPNFSYMNGRPAAVLNIYTGENPNVLNVAEAAKAFVKVRNDSMPEGYELQIWQDASNYFNQRLTTLVKNGASGLILLFIVLLLFLRPALALWVAIGIAIAFIGSLLLLPVTNTSLNVITLFAYIMVLGIVVDDAIIIGESIYAQQQRGIYGLRSAQIGAGMMVKPVFFAVTTTILVFVPLLLLDDDWAYFFVPMATIPILVLIFSLIEASLILPSHLAHLKPEGKPIFPAFNRLRRRVEQGLRYFLIIRYRPFLNRCLNNRGITISSFIVFLMISVALVVGGWLKVQLPPDVELDTVYMTVAFNEKVPFNEIESVAQRVEDAAKLAEQQAMQKDTDSIGYIDNRLQFLDGKVLTVILELTEEQYRSVPTSEFSRYWQDNIGVIQQAERIDVIDSVSFDDAHLKLRIYGSDVVELDQAGHWLSSQLDVVDGMYAIQDDLALGRPELEVTPNRYAQFFGVDLSMIANQLRRAFYGQEVQRIPRGREDVRVMVRYNQENRNNISSLNEFRIRTDDGREVPLEQVANTHYVEGYGEINRVDGQVSLNLYANYKSENKTLQQHMGSTIPDLIERFKQRYPSMKIELSGEQQEVQLFVKDLTRLGLMAIFVIYALLSIQFKSLFHPLLIIIAIPFSLVGSFWAHLLLGYNLSLLSLMGMMASAGVVINDTLVLIDHINNKRRRKDDSYSLKQFIISGAKNRFRPIFLTSVTTFMGLAPIMRETSTQAEFLKPMAISLASGVMTATVVSLVLIPCLYSLGHQIKRNFKPFLFNHIIQGWQGKQLLWKCFAGYYVIGGFFMVLFAVPVAGMMAGIFSFISIPEYLSNYIAKASLFVWIAIFLTWALTSTWRCAPNVKSQTWVPVIRSYVFVAWAGYFYQVYQHIVLH